MSKRSQCQKKFRKPEDLKKFIATPFQGARGRNAERNKVRVVIHVLGLRKIPDSSFCVGLGFGNIPSS